VNDAGGCPNAVDLFLGLKVVELHEGDAIAGRSDNDILAGHDFRIIGELRRMPDGGGSNDARQFLAGDGSAFSNMQ
jgi:hypothetical protein